jgi:hypothetical protein
MVKMSDNNERRIEYMSVSEMMERRHPQNPKGHDLGMLSQLFLTHGYVTSGTIDERTGYWLCGHGRAETLQMMKRQKMDLPRYIEDRGDDWYGPAERGYHSLSDAQALAYIAADNKSTIAGGWDEPALASLLQEVANSTDVALEATGYDADELDDLLRDLEGYEDADWSAEEHWVGLPAYEQGELVSKLKMIVHFETEEDRQDFARRLDLKITEKTNNTWWPVKEKRDLQSIRFEADDD